MKLAIIFYFQILPPNKLIVYSKVSDFTLKNGGIKIGELTSVTLSSERELQLLFFCSPRFATFLQMSHLSSQVFLQWMN